MSKSEIQKYKLSIDWPFHNGLQSYRWDCCFDGCNAKIYTHHETNKIKKFDNHCDYPLNFHNSNHGFYEQIDYIRDMSMERMVALVTDGVPPKQAYEQEILNDVRVCRAWPSYESVYRTLYNRRALYYPALPQSKLAIKDAITSNPNWRYNYHGFRRRQFELQKKHQVAGEGFDYKSEEKLDEDIGVIQQTVNKLKRKLCKLKEIKSIAFGASIADESILYLV